MQAFATLLTQVTVRLKALSRYLYLALTSMVVLWLGCFVLFAGVPFAVLAYHDAITTDTLNLVCMVTSFAATMVTFGLSFAGHPFNLCAMALAVQRVMEGRYTSDDLYLLRLVPILRRLASIGAWRTFPTAYAKALIQLRVP